MVVFQRPCFASRKINQFFERQAKGCRIVCLAKKFTPAHVWPAGLARRFNKYIYEICCFGFSRLVNADICIIGRYSFYFLAVIAAVCFLSNIISTKFI